MEAYAGRLGVYPTSGIFSNSKLSPPTRGLHQAKSLKGSRVPGEPKERRSFDANPLTSIILLRHKYLVDDHKADHDSNDSHTRKLKKHCKRLGYAHEALQPNPEPNDGVQQTGIIG